MQTISFFPTDRATVPVNTKCMFCKKTSEEDDEDRQWSHHGSPHFQHEQALVDRMEMIHFVHQKCFLKNTLLGCSSCPSCNLPVHNIVIAGPEHSQKQERLLHLARHAEKVLPLLGLLATVMAFKLSEEQTYRLLPNYGPIADIITCITASWIVSSFTYSFFNGSKNNRALSFFVPAAISAVGALQGRYWYFPVLLGAYQLAHRIYDPVTTYLKSRAIEMFADGFDE